MIGIFDSGLGGLTTLKELLQRSPQYQYLYLGDTANAPYGKRSPARVQELTEKGVQFLFQQGAQIVLIACNTASTDSLRFLQKKHPHQKILGVLIPAVEKALEVSPKGRIGLLATQHTVQSGNFEREIQKKHAQNPSSPSPSLVSAAAPLLVPLIEEGWSHKPETRSILKKYLLPLKAAQIDTLILGCTHYPILEKEIQRKMGKNCTLINSGKAQAEKFQDYLLAHPEIQQTLTSSANPPSPLFFTTDCPDKFSLLGKSLLQMEIPHPKKIELT